MEPSKIPRRSEDQDEAHIGEVKYDRTETPSNTNFESLNAVDPPEKALTVPTSCSSHNSSFTLDGIDSTTQLRHNLDLSPRKQDPPTLTPARTPLITELEDGTDPLEWSDKYKIWANTTYCIMILSTTYSSSAFAPSVTQLTKEWGIERHLALAGTSTYVLGFALGPFIMAPFSEVFGRKPVYVASFIFLTLFNLVVALAPNISVFLVSRFLAGFCGSSALNNVAASVVDFTVTRNRLRYNTCYRIVSFGGPTLGPFAGSWLTEKCGWRWNMRMLPIFSFVALCLYAFTVPETHRPTLLRKQHHRRRLEMERDPEKRDSSGLFDGQCAELPMPSLKQRLITALKRPFIYLFTEPLVMMICLYTAILYGLLYGLLGAFPYAFMDLRGLSRIDTSWMYLSILLGFLLGAAIIGLTLQDRQFKKAWDAGTYTPETRIGPAAWGSFAVPVGLLIFAWTAPYVTSVHWIGPCIGVVVFSFGIQIVFNSWLSYLADAYGPNSASAMAAATFSRSMLGAAFPLFMKDILKVMTFQGCISMFAAISVPLSICGLLFVKYGAVLRVRSKHAVDPQ
ncbi:unnamed protein product [Sympodiomycopsis kandeliae]